MEDSGGLTGAHPLTEPTLLAAPRSLPSARGVAWVSEGFALFRQAPWVWIAIMLIAVVVSMMVSLVPLGSLALSLLSPVITAGLMIGCKELEKGNELQVAHLLAGFSRRTGALVGAGALYLGLVIGLVLVVGLLGFMVGAIGAASDGQTSPELNLVLLLLMLVAVAMVVPIIMAFYFAPVIIVFHEEVGVVQAFRLSFSGCLLNVMPFLLFGIITFLLAVLAAIPLMLGLLVLLPTLSAAMYMAYKDIFLE